MPDKQLIINNKGFKPKWLGSTTCQQGLAPVKISLIGHSKNKTTGYKPEINPTGLYRKNPRPGWSKLSTHQEITEN